MLVESILGIDSIAIRDSRATQEFRIAAQERVHWHPRNKPLAGSSGFVIGSGDFDCNLLEADDEI